MNQLKNRFRWISWYYTIIYLTETTFTVTNGKDGLTPYIGPNGNWWIGDEDTGEFASYNYETRDITDGLTFIYDYNGKEALLLLVLTLLLHTKRNHDLLDDYPEQYASTYGIIIPDYLGTTLLLNQSWNV